VWTKSSPFAEQGLSKGDGGCVREAIAVIESGAMTSLAEAAESRPGQLPLLRIHRDQLDTGPGNESVQITQTFHSVSRLDHHRSLDKTRHGHASRVGGLNGLKEMTPLGFPFVDCQNCGGIEHHQRGRPTSS